MSSISVTPYLYTSPATGSTYTVTVPLSMLTSSSSAALLPDTDILPTDSHEIAEAKRTLRAARSQLETAKTLHELKTKLAKVEEEIKALTAKSESSDKKETKDGDKTTTKEYPSLSFDSREQAPSL